MRDFAKRPEKDRRELFMATAEAMQVHQAIIEKDFWVCWVLDYLFRDSKWKDKLIFKGGTSLSKAYGAIQRFSEDIDLVVDWSLLGQTEDEALKERSGKQKDKFSDEISDQTIEFLQDEIVPTLKSELAARLNGQIFVQQDNKIVTIGYPQSFTEGSIRKEIILEIGPRALRVPNELKEIRSYAAEHHSDLFTVPSTKVHTVNAELTFWEKATILHQEAHRGIEKPLPPRYSRHYYDLYRLSNLPIRADAVTNIKLLDEVAQFKMKFYRCPWAKYEEAKPGSLKLLPPAYHLSELKRDYDSMKTMLFGTVPSFEEILEGLKVLEKEINELGNSKQ